VFGSRRSEDDISEWLNSMSKADMALLSRESFDKKERDFIEMRIGVPVNRFSDFSTYMACGYKKVWATFRACKIIASTMMTAEFKIVKNVKTADDVTEKFGGFLRKPNPYDSWEELLEMWSFHMELVGNAYWLKDEMDAYGRPKAIYPLLPQFMQVVPDERTRVNRYIYRVNGKELEFSPDELIHFRFTNPNNIIMGMGSIEPSEALYNEYINKTTLGEKFLENGAQMSGILSRETEIIDEDQWRALKKKFTLEYAGTRNAGKVAFLNGKWSYQKLGMTMQEMQSLEKEKWNIEQIFLNHGVPLSVAGVDGAANYATSRQDEINFRKYKVVPMLDLLVGKLNADGFFHDKRKDVRLTYEMSGLVDVKQIVDEYGPLVDKGAMTLNELRVMCNLPIVENEFLNKHYINTGRIPIEMSEVSSNQQIPKLDNAATSQTDTTTSTAVKPVVRTE
jgi:HK97 family phage portal protein